MKAFVMFAVAVSLIVFVFCSSPASACDRCQVQQQVVACSQPAIVCDRVVGWFEVVERTIVQQQHYVRSVPVCGRCHLKRSLCHCAGHVLDVGRAAVRTVVEIPSRLIEDIDRRWDRRDYHDVRYANVRRDGYYLRN